MTNEDKQLLLVDLCARLPYRVKVTFAGYSGREDCILNIQHLNSTYAIEYLGLKPYLRPLTSMTEKEMIDFLQIPDLSQVSKKFISDFKIGNFGIMTNMSNYARNIDWLNKNMFDYRGLIDKGLAIAITEDNNPYKD